MISKRDVIDYIKYETDLLVKECLGSEDGSIFDPVTGDPVKIVVECNTSDGFKVFLSVVSKNGVISKVLIRNQVLFDTIFPFGFSLSRLDKYKYSGIFRYIKEIVSKLLKNGVVYS